MIRIRKEVKGFLSEAVDILRAHTVDGEVITTNNRGHLKVTGKFPNGTRSFVMGTTPSDHRWKHRATSALKYFICAAILKTE